MTIVATNLILNVTPNDSLRSYWPRWTQPDDHVGFKNQRIAPTGVHPIDHLG